MASAPKWPGSAGILACTLSSTAARMAALPGTFSSSCVSVAHDNCSEMAWERRHPCLHAFLYFGQDGRAPEYIFIIVCELALMVSAPKITPGSAGIPACNSGHIFTIVDECNSWRLTWNGYEFLTGGI